MDDKRIDDLIVSVNRIADKLDRVEEHTVRNTVTLERNTTDMADHIERTNLLQTQMKTALLPITIAKWVAGLVGFVAVVIGAVVGLGQLLGKI